ncbi:hypothetical protein Tco_0187136 [Tanacetum coccineum]
MEHGPEKMKSLEKSPEKMKSAEKIKEEDVVTQREMKEVFKGSGAKRKKFIPRKSTRKRQKMEEDAEKEELKGFLDIIPRGDVPIEVELDSEHGSERMKSPEKIEEEDVDTQKEMKEVYKESGEKRKKSLLKKAQEVLLRDKRWKKMLRRKISKDIWI